MHSRVSLAFDAMKAIGIPPQTVKPVLKNLLKLYENNWELIEEENYRALADAIFDLEDCKRMDDKKKEVQMNGESEPHMKRMRLREEDEPSPFPSHNSGIAINEAPLKRPKLEMEVAPQSHLQKERTESFLPLTYTRQKRNESVSCQHSTIENRLASGRMPNAACFEANVDIVPKEMPNHHHHMALIKPKAEPCMDDLPHFEVPLAMIRPLETSPARKEANPDPLRKGICLIGNASSGQTETMEALVSPFVGANNEEDGVPYTTGKSGENLELVNVPESSPTDLEIASSASGEVKLSITCASACNWTDFHMPNLDDVLKRVEDKCLKSYKIIQPNFSIMKLMNDFCQCVLELGTNRVNDKVERLVNVTTTLDSLKKFNLKNDLGARSNHLKGHFKMSTRSSNGSPAFDYDCNNGTQPENFNNVMDKKEKELQGLDSSNINSHSLVVYQPGQLTLDNVKPIHDVADITKGEERIRVSLVNEVTSEKYPPSFYYIPQNIIYQNAYVNFSLARIGDEDCCSDCLGNCLSSPLPCACARETGGEYAYTPEGLIKREFLDECVSMLCYPEKHHHVYCKDCPLERNKNDVIPDRCKGHLVRKFIKECWSKCGCNKQCGNRVVQRGITRNLQVFLTSEGKGWGLRTIEELPRGAFVCEYVGEILTNTELYDRNRQSTGNEKHTYPVLLDADWGSEGVLKDEEALCLDATFYGNVARFINHRCFDANLVEIPVEVETPDRHYYHLAFFTTRKVEPLEELTWDYGIDFDDHNHPVKAFRCCCGSKFCRAMKRSKRGKFKVLRSSG